jgi:predicted amidohydrolase
MRIGILQFAPQVGDVDNNLKIADAILSKANPKDLDLLVLPEMAFSGEGVSLGSQRKRSMVCSANNY